MGVYNICMGKGIVVPIKLFVQKFKKEVEEFHREGYEQETVEKVVKKYIGDFQVSTLGHDAFEGRHGFVFDMFADTENEKAGNKIAKLISQSKEKEDEDQNLPFTTIFCSSLIFIGHFVEICHNDLSYYLKAPEVIYSLAACLPLIMKHYPELYQKDCSSLDDLFKRQQACVWTFTNDCCCCG